MTRAFLCRAVQSSRAVLALRSKGRVDPNKKQHQHLSGPAATSHPTQQLLAQKKVKGAYDGEMYRHNYRSPQVDRTRRDSNRQPQT
jgi:hypothetical protein